MRYEILSCKALLRSDLRRYWPVFFCYTFLWLLILPLGLWTQSRWKPEDMPIKALFANHVYEGMPFTVLLAAAMGVILAMTVYGYLMKSNSVGLMHALPVSRTAQYFTHFGAGMAMVTAGNVLVFLISVLVEVRVGGTVAWKSLLWWLLATELLVFFFFAFAALCASATGWTLGIPILFFGLNFMVKAYSLLINAMGAAFYFGYSMRTDFSAAERWLTPLYYLYQRFAETDAETYAEWQYSIISPNSGAMKTALVYTAVGIGMLVFGWFLYRLRHSETAGDAIVFPWLRPIVRYVIAIAGGLGLGFALYAILEIGNEEKGSALFLLVCQLVMGFLVYCTVEMLMRKRFRIFDKRTWFGLAALGAVIIGLFGVMKLDLTGYEKRIPALEDVESVYVVGTEFQGFESDDPALIALVQEVHRACVSKKGEEFPDEETFPAAAREAIEGKTVPEEVETVLSADRTSYSACWFRVSYALKNGSNLNRQYDVPLYEGDALDAALTRLINSDTAKRESYLHGSYNRLKTEKAIGGYFYNWSGWAGNYDYETQLSAEQAEALRQAILYDVERLPDRSLFGANAAYLNCEIRLDMASDYSVYLSELTADFASACQLLREYGVFDTVDVTGPWELATERNDAADMLAAFGESYDDAALRISGDGSFEMHIGTVSVTGTWEQPNSREVFATGYVGDEEVVYGFTRETSDGVGYLALDGGAVGAEGMAIYWKSE